MQCLQLLPERRDFPGKRILIAVVIIQPGLQSCQLTAQAGQSSQLGCRLFGSRVQGFDFIGHRLHRSLHLTIALAQGCQGLFIFLQHMLAAFLAQWAAADRTRICLAPFQHGPPFLQFVSFLPQARQLIPGLLDHHPQLGETLCPLPVFLFQHFQRRHFLLKRRLFELEIRQGGQQLFQMGALGLKVFHLRLQGQQALGATT